MRSLARFFPILEWGRAYTRRILVADLVAAVVVTIMLIPQSLAYALLAGLPAEIGLYASILPLIAYAIFGTSRTLAVGPVAVVSLMTAAAAGAVAVPGSAEYVAAALILAVMSGAILLAMGLLRLGFLANLLSHPVISGFITASGLIIAASQLKHILGISAGGDNIVDVVGSLIENVGQTSPYTLAIGIPALAFLFWVRKGFEPLLIRIGMPAGTAKLVSKGGPVIAVVLGTLAVIVFDLGALGVATVGVVPTGLPALTVPLLDGDLWLALLAPAALISLIGFVESVSVAQTLAAKRRQSITPDQELIALGASNIAAGFSGGYPVTGGFARSVVNFDAGAETPAAGAFTAIGIAVAALTLTPLLFHLPVAVLGATVIVAVLNLIDLKTLTRTWHYSKSDFAAQFATILVTLLFGVETGVMTGVSVSILLYLWRTSRPHIAVVGQVPGTEHYRNVLRHDVATSPHVLSIRVDESLYFANARAIEDFVQARVAEAPQVRHVVLQCTAVNLIDASALESLELLAHRLGDADIQLNLSEVKGPVMDHLKRSDFFEHLTGDVFLSHHQAMRALGVPIA